MESSYKTRPEWNVHENRPAVEFGELEFNERPIVLEDDDFILSPMPEPFVDRSFVWSADGSPVHVAHVLSAAAYYSAAPNRERFATVRKIGRSIRNLAGALAWQLSYGLQRFAEYSDRCQFSELS